MAKSGKRWPKVKNALRFKAIKEVLPRKKVGQVPTNPTVISDTPPKNDNMVPEVLTRPNSDSTLSEITNQSGSGLGSNIKTRKITHDS